MAGHADTMDRPPVLKATDKRAFEAFLGRRRDRPRAAVLHAVLDLAGSASPCIEAFTSGAGWEHKYALAAALIEQLKFDPELQVGAELVQARLDAAQEALDVRNVYLRTGPVMGR